MEKSDESGGRTAAEILHFSDQQILCRRIFDAIEDPIFIVDRDGIILLANRAVGTLLDAEIGEIVGKPCYAVVHRTATIIEECPFVRSKKSKKRESYTLQMFGRWFKVSIDPILHPELGVIGAIHIITDISDIKRADELRSKLASILETSEYAVLDVSPEGLITSLNAAAVRLLGAAPAQAIGLPVSRFVPEALYETWKKAAKTFQDGKAGQHFDSEIIRPDGTICEISVGISPLHGAHGGVSGYSCLIHDITPQKKAERALIAYITEAALRMKVPLDSVVHEIDHLAAMLEAEACQPHDAAMVLQVQKTHLNHILQNLDDLDCAIAESAEEIPEAYRRFLAGK